MRTLVSTTTCFFGGAGGVCVWWGVGGCGWTISYRWKYCNLWRRLGWAVIGLMRLMYCNRLLLSRRCTDMLLLLLPRNSIFVGIGGSDWNFSCYFFLPKIKNKNASVQFRWEWVWFLTFLFFSESGSERRHGGERQKTCLLGWTEIETIPKLNPTPTRTASTRPPTHPLTSVKNQEGI